MMQQLACTVVLLLTLFADVHHLVSANDRIVDMKNETMSNRTTAAAPSCVSNCTCTPPVTGPQLNELMIDCSNLIDANLSALVEEVDRLLVDRGMKLINLAIVNSPLEAVPPSICNLTRLNRLTLYSNRLISLPLGCFNNMTNLTSLDVSRNRITELQDGLFDGMSNLHQLNLNRNFVSTIGLNVFTAKAGLVSLQEIDLSQNNLTTLEPWPLIRGQLISRSYVNLANNGIADFTNRLGWSFRCGMKSKSMELNLRENVFQHVSDITDGWNITGWKHTFNSFTNVFEQSSNWDKLKYCNNNSTGKDSNDQLCLAFILLVRVFTCDCIDYKFYRMTRLLSRVSLFDKQKCSTPVKLRNLPINDVPLNEFVCEINNPYCPAGCQCTKIPYNKTYVVKCSNAYTMPIALPDTRHPGPFECRYSLDFHGSNLHTIDYRDFFNNTVTVDVSDSSVNSISDDAWRAFSRFENVDLSSNKLTVLPTLLQKENSTFKSIALYGNPWRCQCDDKWIRKWMESLGDRLLVADSVLCGSPIWMSGRSVLSVVNEDEFCIDPSDQKKAKLLEIAIPSSVGLLLLVICLVTVIVRKYRVAMFVRFDIYPFNVDECPGEDMIYDVFLVCAYEDREVGCKIIERLENGDDGEIQAQRPATGFKVYYQECDVNPDDYITGNIQTAIEKSKRVVCLLTKAFLRSKSCMLQFHAAWDRSLKIRKRRLVVIKFPEVDQCLELDQSRERRHERKRINARQPVDDDALLNAGNNVQEVELKNISAMKMFLSTYAYIDHDREDWWQQLIYALPTNRLGQSDDEILQI